MSQVAPEAEDLDTVLEDFLRQYYREDVADLAQHYPREQRSLPVSWADLYQFDPELAEDYRADPDYYREQLEAALARIDLPVAVDLSAAHVRVHDLDDAHTHSPGGYSPSRMQGRYLAVQGQVAKATDVRPRPEELVFECLRCGSTTAIPQAGSTRQDPHECSGCQRQGPFDIRQEDSVYDDIQTLRVETPPELVQGESGSDIDVVVEDDLVETATAGDRVTICGRLALRDDDGDSLPEPYLQGHHITVEQTDFEEIDIDDADRQHIEALASGEYGDPYDLLVDSIAPKIAGERYERIKLALALQLFGGVRVTHPDDSADRGTIHVGLIGDPGTAKSKLLRAISDIAPRSVYASGKGASAAGMTAAAVRDDFGEAEWTLDAGALVKADGGVACVDELDKVQEDAVASMLTALASGRVSVNKAGINATLSAQSALLAGGNPKYGRIDQFESIADQVDLAPELLSRFDLLFLLTDQPDEDRDDDIATQIIESRRTAKRLQASPDDVDEATRDRFAPAVERETLRKWIAYARDIQPYIAEDAVAQHLAESFVELRGINGYDADDPVPVSWRTLEGIQRLAEAAAKVELSATIERRHIDLARELVGTSLRQFGRDEEGQFDADVVETGTAMTQRERMKTIASLARELQDEYDGAVPREALLDECEEENIDREQADHEIDNLLDSGELYQPETDKLRKIA